MAIATLQRVMALLFQFFSHLMRNNLTSGSDTITYLGLRCSYVTRACNDYSCRMHSSVILYNVYGFMHQILKKAWNVTVTISYVHLVSSSPCSSDFLDMQGVSHVGWDVWLDKLFSSELFSFFHELMNKTDNRGVFPYQYLWNSFKVNRSLISRDNFKIRSWIRWNYELGASKWLKVKSPVYVQH